VRSISFSLAPVEQGPAEAPQRVCVVVVAAAADSSLAAVFLVAAAAVVAAVAVDGVGSLLLLAAASGADDEGPAEHLPAAGSWQKSELRPVVAVAGGSWPMEWKNLRRLPTYHSTILAC